MGKDYLMMVVLMTSITLTLFDAVRTNLNKSYNLDKNDAIVSSSFATMSKGTYKTITLTGPVELNNVLNNLLDTQAVAIGVCNNGNSGKIKSNKSKQKDAINRSKDNFGFSNGFMFDIDESSLAINEVIPALCVIDPNLKNASILVRVSSSYGIHKTGEQPKVDSCGYHVWVLGVKDPTDIERYGKDFAKRCWLAGKGFIKISKCGSLLVRQLIDVSVFSPERLVFEATPTLGVGIEQTERPYRIQYGASNV